MEGGVPPPVGAFAEWTFAGWDVGGWAGGGVGDRPRTQWSAVVVGDGEGVGGAGEGDLAAVMGPVVVRADEHEVVEVGGAAVFPVLEVVGVQGAGVLAAGDHAGAVAVFQGAP